MTDVERLAVSAYTIPTDAPESDATLVVVEAHAAGEIGLGYTYADVATARFLSRGWPPWSKDGMRLP